MPRGKNYVNNNRGVFLQAKKGVKVSEKCFYGAGCTRPDCIYQHDKSDKASQQPKSTEPCMAYLAGICSFEAATCRKRHPRSQAECDDLISHYQRIPCRFGSECKTKGCLFKHPQDVVEQDYYVAPSVSSWKPAPPVAFAPNPSAPMFVPSVSFATPTQCYEVNKADESGKLNVNARSFVPNGGFS
jgi:hypothetical protein